MKVEVQEINGNGRVPLSTLEIGAMCKVVRGGWKCSSGDTLIVLGKCPAGTDVMMCTDKLRTATLDNDTLVIPAKEAKITVTY